MPTPDMTKTGRLVPSNYTPATSALQSSQRQTFAGLRQRFKGLDAPAKSQWRRASDALNALQQRTGKRKMTPANAYISLNSARLAIGLAITDACPVDLSPPPMYGDITVSAISANGVLTIRLEGDAYPHSCIVQSALPEPEGRASWANGAFKATTTLSGITPQGVVITPEITALWGPQSVGMTIPLRIVAVSAAGVKRGFKSVDGTVASLTAEATGDDEDTELHAA